MMSNTFTPKQNYRVTEFCEVFGVGRSKFYELVKSGDLKTVKLGSTTLITRGEAERFQAQLEGAA